MKQITLKNAEVVTQYKSNDTFKLKTLDNGSTIISFSVKTKINDRAEKSPVVYDNCARFCKTQEELDFIKNALVVGNVIDVTGRAERQKAKDSDKYYDKIIVDNVTIISGRTEPETPVADEDLPF